MATRYETKPSVLLGLDDPWAAYDLDLAAAMEAVRALQGQRPGQRWAKRGGSGTGKVSSVRGLVRGKLRKVRIPESGIW